MREDKKHTLPEEHFAAHKGLAEEGESCCLVWLQTREPQAASRKPRAVGQVSSRSSQIAARSIEARHVLRHDCSSQSTARSSQTVAQAVRSSDRSVHLAARKAQTSAQGVQG